MKRNSLIDRSKLVITVLAFEKHVESPVDLGVGLDLEGRSHLIGLVKLVFQEIPKNDRSQRRTDVLGLAQRSRQTHLSDEHEERNYFTIECSGIISITLEHLFIFVFFALV